VAVFEFASFWGVRLQKLAAELLDYGLERGQKAQILCHDFLLFD
jgi:hypothetical protein